MHIIMHWLEHVFALPAFTERICWYVKRRRNGDVRCAGAFEDQRKLELKERSVTVLTAERIVEVENEEK